MTHTDVRDALTGGRIGDAVADHLDACPACRSFAGAVEHLERLAPSLAGTPPADLADRILAQLDLTGPATLSRTRRQDREVREDPSRHSIWAGAARRVTAMAAALLLVVGLAAVLQRTGADDPHQVVLASADRTTSEGSARVEIQADAEVVVDVPDAAPGEVPPTPDLSEVPQEMHAHIEREWARLMADFELQLRAFEEQMDATVRDAQRQIEEAQRQMEDAVRRMQESFGGSPEGWEGWTPPRPPAPPSAPERGRDPSGEPRAEDPAPPTPPTSLSTRVTIEGSGAITFGERLRLEGTARPEGTVDVGEAARFGLAVDGGGAAYLGPDGTWTGLPGAAGPLGGVLLDAGAVARVLASPAGDVEAVGDVELEGELLRVYRFTVDEEAVGGVEGSTDVRARGGWNAEAWIDGEGRTRRLELTADVTPRADATTSWRTSIALRLSDFGADPGDTSAPRVSGRTDLPGSASLLLYPFGPNVTATSRTVAEVSAR